MDPLTTPVDAARVWRDQVAEDVSELEALTERGVRFARKPRPIASFVILGVICGALSGAAGWLLVEAIVEGQGDVAAALILLFPFALGLAAAISGYAKRNDQIVMDDTGVVLLRGKMQLVRIAWADLRAAERYWFEFVRVAARDGRCIWVTSAVEQHESLQRLLAWLPEVSESVKRASGSLRRGLESALAGDGISFRFGMGDVVREGWRALFLALGAVAIVWKLYTEDTALFQAIVLWLLCGTVMAGSAWFGWRAFAVCRRLGDTIAFTDKGVALSSSRISQFVAWRDAAKAEAIRQWPVGAGFHIRDASGKHTIDDEPGFRHRTAARMLLQFMLFREMRAQNTWEHVRVFDALRL